MWLLILGILGKILLAVLLLLLAVLLLLLFGPVSDEGKGEKSGEDAAASLTLSFCGKLFSFTAAFQEEDLRKELKLLGFRLPGKGKSGRKKTEKVKPKGKRQAGENDSCQEEESQSGKPAESDSGQENRNRKTGETQSQEAGETKNRKADEAKNRKAAGMQNRKSRKIRRLWEFLQEEDNREGLSQLVSELLQFLKKLLPQRFLLSGTFGTEDPALTGWLCGLASFVYAAFPEEIDLTPDFTEEILEGRFFLSGRMRLVQVLQLLYRLRRSEKAWRCAVFLFRLLR